MQQIPIHIPTSTSKGSLRILVSDGDTLDRVRRAAPLLGRKLDLASTIALLNKQHVNNRVYVSLLEADPEAMVADKVMPPPARWIMWFPARKCSPSPSSKTTGARSSGIAGPAPASVFS